MVPSQSPNREITLVSFTACLTAGALSWTRTHKKTSHRVTDTNRYMFEQQQRKHTDMNHGINCIWTFKFGPCEWQGSKLGHRCACGCPGSARPSAGTKLTARGHIDGLVQDCSNSNALAMELLQSCTEPSTWFFDVFWVSVITMLREFTCCTQESCELR